MLASGEEWKGRGKPLPTLPPFSYSLLSALYAMSSYTLVHLSPSFSSSLPLRQQDLFSLLFTFLPHSSSATLPLPSFTVHSADSSPFSLTFLLPLFLSIPLPLVPHGDFAALYLLRPLSGLWCMFFVTCACVHLCCSLCWHYCRSLSATWSALCVCVRFGLFLFVPHLAPSFFVLVDTASFPFFVCAFLLLRCRSPSFL